MNWLQRFVNGAQPTPSTTVETPVWLKKELRLPPWAKVCDTHSHKLCGRIKVDTSAAMREWLELLTTPVNTEAAKAGLAARGADELTQYWLEVAYQCVKLDVQMAIETSALDPRQAAKPVEFHFVRAPEYAQADYPPGPVKTKRVRGKEVKLRGAELASNGLEAREHYKRIRGRLPF